MELLQLKYFCDAAQTENFSKTARKYLVPTSNISQSIKRLEKELECELFDHKKNKIALNDEGKQFYASVSQALLLLDAAKAHVLEKGEQLQGDIRLACMSNRGKVTNAIEAFLKQHPQVNFIIQHSLSKDQDLDVIISDIHPAEYSEKLLLVDEQISVAMNKKHPLASKPLLTVAELEHERFITMPPNSSLHKITMDACAEADFIPNVVIQIDDPFYLRRYIEMGLGIAFVPSLSWNGLFPPNIVLKKAESIRRKTYAFLPKRKYVKHSVEVFLQFLKDEMK